jgi:hypothetical protein
MATTGDAEIDALIEALETECFHAEHYGGGSEKVDAAENALKDAIRDKLCLCIPEPPP